MIETPEAMETTKMTQGGPNTEPTTFVNGNTPSMTFSGVAGWPPVHIQPPSMSSYTNLELNLRAVFNPFNLPSLESVAYAIKNVFPEDDGLILHPLGGWGIGIYRIQLTNPVKDLSDLTAKFPIMSADGKITEPVYIRLIVPAPKYNRSNNIERRQGTLVTIVRGAIGTHRAIPNSVFDKTLEEHGEIIKPTELQKLRGTSVLNGNSYCVIDTTNKGTIPDSLSLTDPTTKETVQFHLRYKGQSWFCRRCDERHVGPCKALQAFYEANDRRAKEKINIKIASDSTLRCAEQVGLRTDIMCMPGGGLGQIANAIKDDPDIKDRKGNHSAGRDK